MKLNVTKEVINVTEPAKERSEGQYSVKRRSLLFCNGDSSLILPFSSLTRKDEKALG